MGLRPVYRNGSGLVHAGDAPADALPMITSVPTLCGRAGRVSAVNAQLSDSPPTCKVCAQVLCRIGEHPKQKEDK